MSVSKKMRSSFVFVILTSILLWLAYPPFSLRGLLPFGIFFSVLYLITAETKRPRRIFLEGTIAGFLYFGLTMKWFWTLYPLDWAGISSKSTGFLIVMGIWVISALAMAVWWGIWLVASYRLLITSNPKKRTSFPIIPSSLCIASLFVVCEYARSWFFGFVWAGKETLWGPHWTLSNIAYIFADHTFVRKLAALGGIYLIEWIIIFISAVFGSISITAYQQRTKKKLFFASALAGIIGLSIFFSLSFKEPDKASKLNNAVQIAVIQTYTSTDLYRSGQNRLENFKAQLLLLRQAAEQKPAPRVILFPEGADFFSTFSTVIGAENAEHFLQNLFPQATLIIDNNILSIGGQRTSKILYLDSQQGLVGTYDKQLLTPGGEFMPYLLATVLRPFIKNQLANFLIQRGLSKNPTQAPIVSLSDASNSNASSSTVSITSLVCSGLFSPSLTIERTQKNPGIIFALTSTALFKGTHDLIEQTKAIAQLRAVEQKKYLVVSANKGLSYIIDERGNVIKKAKNQTTQLFTGTVVPHTTKTIYNTIGDWPILLFAGFITIFMILWACFCSAKPYAK